MNHSLHKRLWYRQAAESWIEGIPMGNGRLGIMTEGGVNRDHMYINEESIWAGHPGDGVRTDAREAIEELQRQLFQNESEGVEELVMNRIMPKQRWFGSYQPFGELEIRSLKPIEYKSYERCLDLNTGIVSIQYTADEENMADSRWKREYLVSAPHQLVVIHYTCPPFETLDLEISLSREQESHTTAPVEGCLMLEGQCGDGIRFAGFLQAVVKGGSMKHVAVRKDARPTLQIHGAKEVDIYLSVRTDFTCENYAKQCRQDLEEAKHLGYEEIKQQHMIEYQTYYNRFELEFEDECELEVKGLDTYQRLRRIKRGGRDENFYALLVHYHRYLLLSASRPGCLPSNLQGLWNYQIFAPWESDYHINVNLEINYWPVEGYNLSECHMPLFDWMKRVSVSGAKTAWDYYGARGWTIHHASNIFAHTAPCAVTIGLWPMGGAWLSRHLYEHYLYTGDEEFLAEHAWPMMKGAAQFLLDFLIEAPEGIEGAGYLVTNPSHSPENKYYQEDGKVITFTYGATMDFEIIGDLFGNCLAVIEHLRVAEDDFEKEFEACLKEVLKRIPEVKISKRTGGIQEWIGDYEEVDSSHRHMSHLYGVYPARDITPHKTPRLAEAAKKSLERKLKNNYDGQGWSYGWMSCLWTRLREPQRAYEALEKIIRNHLQHNLFIEAHGFPQVGDAQAIPAAILEMLVQFDGEKILLLPALPKEWSSGRVKGLRTVGGYVIDMSWKDGVIIELKVHEEAVFHRYSLVKCESSFQGD